MRKIKESRKDFAIKELSEIMNNKRVYKDIQDIAIARFFGHSIDNDSQFWHELEELIINKIIEHIELKNK